MASEDQIDAQTAAAAAEHSGGALLRWCSTFGIATMTLVSIATIGASLSWSLQGLLGLPDWLAYGGFAVFLVLGIWLGVWAALRNWRVERRLERGLEIDPPVFSLRGQLNSDLR
jgi:uncharacterized membrane protein YcjF (UPF0283 family)